MYKIRFRLTVATISILNIFIPQAAFAQLMLPAPPGLPVFVAPPGLPPLPFAPAFSSGANNARDGRGSGGAGLSGLPGAAGMPGLSGLPGAAGMSGLSGLPVAAFMPQFPGVPGLPGMPGLPTVQGGQIGSASGLPSGLPELSGNPFRNARNFLDSAGIPNPTGNPVRDARNVLNSVGVPASGNPIRDARNLLNALGLPSPGEGSIDDFGLYRPEPITDLSGRGYNWTPPRPVLVPRSNPQRTVPVITGWRNGLPPTSSAVLGPTTAGRVSLNQPSSYPNGNQFSYVQDGFGLSINPNGIGMSIETEYGSFDVFAPRSDSPYEFE